LVVQKVETPESLMTQRPDVPAALAALIHRLLSRDPADRPRDAGGVLHTLDALIAAMEPTNVARVKRHARLPIVVLLSVISLAVVGIIALVLPRVRSSAATVKCESSNPDASQAYDRGSVLIEGLEPGGLQRALTQFEKAIQLDPTFACGWAGLANVYTYQAVFSDEPPEGVIAKAHAAVNRALALDSNVVEAHAVRAHQLFVLECRRNDAEREFQRTLALDSTYALGHRWYGWFLHMTRRNEAGLAHLRRARNLSPLSQGAEALLGRVFVNMNQPDSAIRYLQNVLAFNRDHAGAYEQLAFAWLEKYDSARAIAAMQLAAIKNGRDSAYLAYIYAKTGKGGEAREILRRLVNTESQRRLANEGLAIAYAALGDVDEAFRRLERQSCVFALGVAPGYESLRSDPRFADLVLHKGLR
jgi:Tfp pilus assembly protein PilF